MILLVLYCFLSKDDVHNYGSSALLETCVIRCLAGSKICVTMCFAIWKFCLSKSSIHGTMSCLLPLSILVPFAKSNPNLHSRTTLRMPSHVITEPTLRMHGL